MQDALYLEEGKLVVYKRDQTFYARIRLAPRRYIWRSLRTSDAALARRAGLKLFYNLEFKQEQGLPIASRSVKAVIDDYVAMREKSFRQGRTSSGMLRQIRRVVRFWREYIGNRSIESVGDKEIKGYLEWRRDYYTRQKQLPKNARLVPTDKTLQWEIMLGKAIIKWATERGLRGNKPAPTFSFTPKTKRVRPVAFSGVQCSSASGKRRTSVGRRAENFLEIMFSSFPTAAYELGKRTTSRFGMSHRSRTTRQDGITDSLSKERLGSGTPFCERQQLPTLTDFFSTERVRTLTIGSLPCLMDRELSP